MPVMGVIFSKKIKKITMPVIIVVLALLNQLTKLKNHHAPSKVIFVPIDVSFKPPDIYCRKFCTKLYVKVHFHKINIKSLQPPLQKRTWLASGRPI
jgi:hypothetical protein